MYVRITTKYAANRSHSINVTVKTRSDKMYLMSTKLTSE